MALIEVDFLEPENRSRSSRKKGKQNQIKSQVIGSINNGLKLKNIMPLTDNQKITFNAFNKGKNLLLHGFAGTGKTFCALYLALEEVLSNQSQYKKIVIVRSACPTRDVGFLPGNLKEKMSYYEEPYIQICSELFGRGDAYSILKQKGLVEFTSTSYLRGITFNDSIVIVDEIQNNNFGELTTIITRLGNNSRIILSGDYRQTDLNGKYDTSGLQDFMKIVKIMKSFEDVEFEIEDIVRSGVVKEFIIARDKLHL